MSGRSERDIGVALCQCVGDANPPSVAASAHPGPTLIRHDLCRHPEVIPDFVQAAGLQGVVVGSCGSLDAARLSTSLRAAGLQPWDVELVWVDWWRRPTFETSAVLAAALARLREAPAVRGDHLAFRWPTATGKLTRRTLLTLARPAPTLVPAPEAGRCVASYGCRRCQAVCPREAIAIDPVAVQVDRQRCDGCARCVVACPANALTLPGHGRPELFAAVQALLANAEDSDVRPIVAFACPHAYRRLRTAVEDGRLLPEGVLPFAVRRLDPTILALVPLALALGAAGAWLLACGDTCGGPTKHRTLERQVAALHRLLRPMGLDERWVQLHHVDASGRVQWGSAALRANPRVGATTKRGTSRPGESLGHALALLADRFHLPPERPFDLTDLPAGCPTVAAERCTLCGLCAERCPAAALRLDADGDGVTLEAVAASCEGCGLCVAVCPERAISIRRHVRVADLVAPTATLAKCPVDTCAVCGVEVAPSALRLAVSRRLGRPHEAPVLCPDCALIHAPRTTRV